MRRDPGEHPNGLIDFALCSTIKHLAIKACATQPQLLSLSLGARRRTARYLHPGRTLDAERVGILPIETLWSFNNKYQPTWLPRYLVYPAVESFVPVVAATLRAESITELPVIGRFLASDPSNRPGTVVPPES